MFGRGFSICGVYYSSVVGTTTFLFFIMLYAIGDAINNEDNVPITTPRIIANAKLRIESPPRMKIHSNTINVLNDVLMVRASVVFRESLNNTRLSRFGYKPKNSRTRSKITTLSLIE